MAKRRLWTLALGICASMLAVNASLAAGQEQEAAGVPAGFADSLVAEGLEEPTAMAFAPDGRLFVAQKTGKLRVIKNGDLQKDHVLKVNPALGKEQGLLGVAVDPGFGENGRVYIHYTARNPKVHNRVTRFSVKETASGDTVIRKGSRKNIFVLNPVSDARHNGGAIHFKGGKLFVAVGDDTDRGNAKTLDNLFGKMLRINKDGSIPRSNPFYDKAKGKNRAIWARGLRNPYTFAVQPGTGKMYINDVGAKTWEEINRGRKGANYGWPRYEGPENNRRYAAPIFAYGHGDTATTGCSITGGSFYNPRDNTFGPGYGGDYFFGDFCNGWIRRYDPKTDKVQGFATTPKYGLVDMRVSKSGDLYYLHRATGSVHKISKN